METDEMDEPRSAPLPLDRQYAALRGLLECPGRALIWREFVAAHEETFDIPDTHCGCAACIQHRATLLSSPLSAELFSEPLPWRKEEVCNGFPPSVGLVVLEAFDRKLCKQILELHQYDLSGVRTRCFLADELQALLIRAGLDYGKEGKASAWEKLLRNTHGSLKKAADLLKLDPSLLELRRPAGEEPVAAETVALPKYQEVLREARLREEGRHTGAAEGFPS